MTKKALLILAEGAEEMEVVISINTLRRAGIEVTVAGLKGSEAVKCSCDIIIQPDTSLQEAVNGSVYDIIILPGGFEGADNFIAFKELGEILKKQESEGRMIAAICAAPTALKAHGIAKGKRITSYPAFQDKLSQDSDYIYQEDRVVIDGNITTSRGPGTSFEFALSLVEQLVGKEKSDLLTSLMLVKV